LSTPSGSPASLASRASSKRGQRRLLGRLSTTELPVANAGATFHDAISNA